MSELTEKIMCLSIPFLCPEQAILACEVLSVDKELKVSQVRRQITTDGPNLIVNFHGAEFRRLRVAVNSLLKNVHLIVKTIYQCQVPS